MAETYSRLDQLSFQDVLRLGMGLRPQASGCWEWQGQRNIKGYGVLAIRGAQKVATHRMMYRIYYGMNPRELLVCHKCDNPPCCRPDHLFLGTTQENMNDAVLKGRKAKLHPSTAPHLNFGESIAKGQRAANYTKHGSQNPNTILTDNDVRTIRARWASGSVTQVQLAKDYGMDALAINRIIRRKTWKYVD